MHPARRKRPARAAIVLPSTRPGQGLIRVHLIGALTVLTVGSWTRPPGRGVIEYTLWSRAGRWSDGDEPAQMDGVLADLRGHLAQRIEGDGPWWR